MLIVKYERRDFFNKLVYTEDKKRDYNKADVKKAFSLFIKDCSVAIEIENTVMFWDKLSDYDNRIVTLREYDDKGNHTDVKKAYDKVKKDVYSMVND